MKRILKCLAKNLNLRILQCLAKEGSSLSTTKLSQKLKDPPNRVGMALVDLQRHNLVVRRRSGQHILTWINPETCSNLTDWLEQTLISPNDGSDVARISTL